MKRWTDKTDREAEAFYPTLSEAKIRQYQDLTRQQLRWAHEQRNLNALADLQRQEEALTQEMLRRCYA